MAIKRCGLIGATDGDGVVPEQARAEFELGQRRRGRGADVCMCACMHWQEPETVIV